MHPDDIFLARTVELAHTGSQNGDGGPFGAVITHDGKIIGEGWNRVLISKDPTAHAEVGAIRMACQHLGRYHLADCVLYASSEPCPMCLAAAYWARIPRIVFANRRTEAASIGFCDDELYDELRCTPEDRKVIMTHRPSAAARDALQQWAANPGRIVY